MWSIGKGKIVKEEEEEGGRNMRAEAKVRAEYDSAAQGLVGLPAILPNSRTPWGAIASRQGIRAAPHLRLRIVN